MAENELEKIDEMIDKFTEKIKERMHEKFKDGYRGWGGDYSAHRLAIEMNKDTVLVLKDTDVEKNLIDIGARSAMLYYRQAKKEKGRYGCSGAEIEPGVFSGCDQSGGDCPTCEK